MCLITQGYKFYFIIVFSDISLIFFNKFFVVIKCKTLVDFLRILENI